MGPAWHTTAVAEEGGTMIKVQLLHRKKKALKDEAIKCVAFKKFYW